MATPRRPGRLPMTKANNDKIVSMIENKLGPVGKGHHNSHRTAAILRWLDRKESSKGKASGASTPPPNPYGDKAPDNPNVDSNPNNWLPKKDKKYGISPKGTPDINLGKDKMDSTTPERMPVIGRKKRNASDGLDPNIHLPAPRALSPREARYYEYLKKNLKEPGGVEKLNQFLNTVHDQNA